jgi:hypothetical protein
MICKWCGENFTIDEYLDFSGNEITCPNCFGTIIIATEEFVVGDQEIILSTDLPVLEEGELVRITNEQHPWYNELSLICDRKHKHYRIEANGSKLWVPEHWVERIDD